MEDLLTQRIIGAAIEVHKRLGPGLLESTYELCLSEELKHLHIAHERQSSLPLIYRGVTLDAAYRIDFLVERKALVEIKAVDSLAPIHIAQLLTYLRLLKLKSGLLINFNVSLLKDGIKRVSNDHPVPNS